MTHGFIEAIAASLAFVCLMLILMGLMELFAWLVRPSEKQRQRRAWIECLFNGGNLWKP